MSEMREGAAGEASDDGVLKPLVGWSYPFVMGTNATDVHGGIASLGRALGGTFPLAANGLVHGGMHFDDGTAGTTRQDDGVRVIADGEVVAYRQDGRYPRLHYPDGQKLLYSSSFVLVRHRLALPGTEGVSQASATPSQGDTLDFFSLYMHLQDWRGYEKTAAGDKTPNGSAKARHMSFWKGAVRYRVGEKANDLQVLAKVKAGTRAASTNVLNVESVPGEASLSRDDGTSEIQRGIRVRDTPRGQILALLPCGAEFSAERCSIKGWVKITGVDVAHMLPYVLGGKADARTANGYVYAGELEEMIVPSPLDSVVVLDKPYPIKSGELVGYMGEYQIYSDATPLPAKPKCAVLHLEVFAGDQLSRFLEKSRAYANSAKDEDKTRLRVTSGVRFVSRSDADQQINAGLLLQATKDSPSSGAWAKVQPMKVRQGGSSASPRDRGGEMQGRPLWVERRLSNRTTKDVTQAWQAFPLQAAKQKEDEVAFERIFSRDQLENQTDDDKAQDDKGVRWWRVAAAGVSTNDIYGWVCEKGHAGTRWESQWAWPGFNLVNHTNVSVIDLFKRGCQVSGSVFRDEADDFKAVAREVGNSPLIEQVERAIGQREKLKGSVSRLDLGVAMRKPWFAANLSRIIVRYENEWGGGMAKWEALSVHMREQKEIWETEMIRIRRLQWWGDVQSISGFPTSAVVYHIHPLGLVENFIKEKCRCIQYSAMYASRGLGYRGSEIKRYSHYLSPIDRSPSRLAGESRRHGDASQQVQRKVIDMLVGAAKTHGLTRDDLLMVLAIARVESGFNPDAAAGITSAAGLEQFVDDTAHSYGMSTNSERFDASRGAIALVRHYLDNKRLASRRYVGRELEIMIYAFHHDGPSLKYGGREMSISKVMPLKDLFDKNVCDQIMG